MRYLVVVILFLTCMAAMIRIDGHWSPSTFQHHVELAIERMTEPGKALLSGVERQLSPRRIQPEAGTLSAPYFSFPLPKAMAGGAVSNDADDSACS